MCVLSGGVCCLCVCEKFGRCLCVWFRASFSVSRMSGAMENLQILRTWGPGVMLVLVVLLLLLLVMTMVVLRRRRRRQAEQRGQYVLQRGRAGRYWLLALIRLVSIVGHIDGGCVCVRVFVCVSFHLFGGEEVVACGWFFVLGIGYCRAGEEEENPRNKCWPN